ncbi:MAG: hypothetical protein KDK00_10380 [Rhodobacteraceae bacterium]|nr:hypothetical protein [Paracoccaceae bacterium]
MKRLFVLLMLLAGLFAAPVLAGDLGPVIPRASGKPHPEGNEFWRINHMLLMVHDRDQTMRLGNREVQASLAECVDCHAVNGADGAPVSAEDERHFCRTCHDYVAVKIDCFQCHNSRPEAPKQALRTPEPADMPGILAYLKEAGE